MMSFAAVCRRSMPLALPGLLLLSACPPKVNIPEQYIEKVGVLAPLRADVGEVREEDEERHTHKILEAVYGKLAKEYPPKEVDHMPRDAHQKMHGCVVGTFTVVDNLNACFQHGVFKEPGKSYPLIVRYSNSDANVQTDKTPDARGMALKLLGVDGEKLIPGEKDATTHDFMLLNADRFFVRDLKTYVGMLQALEMGKAELAAWLATHPYEAGILLEAFGQTMQNPVLHRYNSATPYLLGDEAVKWEAMPCVPPPPQVVDKKHPNYLHDAMKKTLATEDVCYDFYALRRSVPENMPIEDATVAWPRKQTERVRLARIHIPKQRFDTKVRHEACENYSFTPWHALPEHKPLGAVNRARYSVYELISRFRNHENGVPHVEPTALPE